MGRVLFFSLYQSGGIKNLAGMSFKEKIKYAMWGKQRVIDGTNDMLVEVRL